MIAFLIRMIFSIYSLMILLRIIGSWFPGLNDIKFVQLIYSLTDPYLNIFRKFIPALSGFDFSPIVAIFALQIVEKLLISLVSH